MKTFLIAESNIGYHSQVEDDSCEVVSFVFIPNIKKEKDTFKAHTTINNQKILDVVDYCLSEKDSIILIGYDLDENGELMAQAMREYLITRGISNENILRTPLTEDGYVVSVDFLDIQDYMKFRYYQNLFLKRLSLKKLSKLSVLDFLSIKYLFEKANKKIELEKIENKIINLNKTSTMTFVVNNLIKDM